MATKATGAATDPTPTATAPAEPVVPAAEPAQNTNAIENQLIELQGKLSEFQATQVRLEKERNEAIAERLRQEAMYRGLQNQTTKTLQEAARNRKEYEQAFKDRAAINAIQEQIANQTTVLETLASRVLDADEVKELTYKQREDKLKRAEQALIAAQSAPVTEPAPTAASSQQEAALEFDKSQFVSFYFPGVEVDPNDPRIDWATDITNTQEAFRRFNASMVKIIRETDQAQTQDVVSQLKAQSEASLKELEARNQELTTQNTAEIERVKAESLTTARKEAENRLRKLGADVEGTPVSDGARRTLSQQINEIDDSLLYRDPKEYARQVELVKKQVREIR